VTARDELGILVAGVVDHRFVQTAETRTRHCAHVFEVERFENVHHEVGAGAVDGEHFTGCRWWIALHGREWECARRRGRGSRRVCGERACTGQGAGSRRYSLEELSPSNGSLFPRARVRWAVAAIPAEEIRSISVHSIGVGQDRSAAKSTPTRNVGISHSSG
jgi:hypothetical protein